VQVIANQRKESAVAFLEAAVAYYAKLGIRIEREMTDNGSCYRSKTFRAACERLVRSPLCLARARERVGVYAAKPRPTVTDALLPAR
jgi:transposase InsO family protein